MSWTPSRSLAEADALICAPGNPHEVETALVDGRVQRVYKNLWPSLRDFWTYCATEYSERTYIVFEGQRFTYKHIYNRSVKLAALFRIVYGVRKGDRVGICSRNCPDYLVAFWACHLLGAVSVLANAWLPTDPLRYCLEHTECRLVLLDPERADLLEPVAEDISAKAGTQGFLVFDSLDGKGYWEHMYCLNEALNAFTMDGGRNAKLNVDISPEDNATIMFTSGTTGLPKGVLSTQRMFLTNLRNISVGVLRAKLRQGENLPEPKQGAQQGVLVAVPLFHVTGSTSLSMLATLNGQKIILMRKWVVEDAARLMKVENISVGGGVPTMVSDLTESSLVGHRLDALIFGGAPAPSVLPAKARRSFPTAIMSQTYGMTETNSISVACAGNDYLARPSSTGLPSPVNDMMIVHNGKAVPAGQRGEVWLRGPNVMKEYWRDPEATAKTLTRDGWLRTGDLGSVDEEGFLYIHDRLKDIIIRGGENISSVSVEDAMYEDPRVLEAAAVGLPDSRLGELVAVVVSTKPPFYGQVTEGELLALARSKLPRFAVPVMILVQDRPLEHTPSEKITKGELRKLAQKHWPLFIFSNKFGLPQGVPLENYLNFAKQQLLSTLRDLCLLTMKLERTLAEEAGSLRQAYVTMFRQHLEEVEAHLAGKEAKQFPPSFVPPAGYWSSAEKGLFFHGLCRHSRLRPDLIAESIGTKTMLDVCAYIDALEATAARAEFAKEEDFRSKMDIAMQVSRFWIQWENRQTDALLVAESRWEEAAREGEQEAELAAKEATVPTELSEDALRDWKSAKEQQWALEMTLSNLDPLQLRILDSVFMDDNRDQDQTEQHMDSSQRLPQTTNDSDHPLSIDTSVPHPADGLDDDDDDGNDDKSLSPRSRRRFRKRMYMRRKRAELTGGDPLMTTDKLKPGRKRKERPSRPRPKHYNSKKRRLNDDEARSSSPSENEDASDADAPHKSDADTIDHIRHPHASGTAKARKIRDELQAHGLLDEEVLRDDDLDFFRLGPLSRLINAHDFESGGCISASTISLLKQIIIEFVTDLVHQSIVVHEQDTRLKADKKVWHFHTSPVVTPLNIVLAAEMMGVPVRHLNLPPPNACRLSSDTHNASSPSSPEVSPTQYPYGARSFHGSEPNEEAIEEDDFEWGDDVMDLGSASLEPLYGQIQLPFIRLPPRLSIPSVTLSSSYSQEELTEDIDESALATELEEEEILDQQDQAAERNYEKGLWELADDPLEA